tara:strand:+ start:992 stop:1585 length:594 start_codon:yes stop_codon:yes gene_type:complete
MNITYSIGILIFAIVLNLYITYIVEQRAKNVYDKNQKPMYDIVATTLPNMNQYHYLCDLLCLIPMILYIYTIVYKRNQIDEIILMFSVIFILRGLSMYPTTFPSLYCYETRTKIPTMGACHDCMFSGHLAFTLLPTLLLIYHGWSPIILLYPICFSFFQVASRSHYSVDILISWYITILVFIIVQFKCLQNFMKQTI